MILPTVALGPIVPILLAKETIKPFSIAATYHHFATMASVPRQLGSQTGAILELAEYGLGGCLLPVRVVSAKKDSHPAVFIFKNEGGPIRHKVRKASK